MSSWQHSSIIATAASGPSFVSLFHDEHADLFASSPTGHSPLRSSPLSPSAPLTSDDPFDLLSAVAGPLPLSSPSPKRPTQPDSDKRAAAPRHPQTASSTFSSSSLFSSTSPALGSLYSSIGSSASLGPMLPAVHYSPNTPPSHMRVTSVPVSSRSTSLSFAPSSPSTSSSLLSNASTSSALGPSHLSSVSLNNASFSSVYPYVRVESNDVFFSPSPSASGGAPGGPSMWNQPSPAAASPVSQMTSMDFGSLAGLSSPFFQATAEDSPPTALRTNSTDSTSSLSDGALTPTLPASSSSPALLSATNTEKENAPLPHPAESESVSFFSPIFWNAAPSPTSPHTSTFSSTSATPTQSSAKHARMMSQPSDLSSMSRASLASSQLTSPSPSPYARTRSNSNSNINPFVFTPTTTSLPHPSNESPFASTAPTIILPVIAPFSSPSSSCVSSASSSSGSDSSSSPTSTTATASSSSTTLPSPAAAAPSAPSNASLAAAMSDGDKQARLRAKIANEILTSETNYVESLSTLLGCFLQPLQSSFNQSDIKPFVTEEQLSILTSNINQIAQLNARFLSDIQDRIENWTEETCLGPLFLEFAHFFKIYTWYVSNHDQSVMCMQQLENNARWREFVAEVMKKPRVRNLPLSSFLIMPIQRIPRYKLLLSELLKNTPVGHPDHDELEKALGLVSNVAAHINDSVRANENRMKVREIQAQFTGANFVSPSRRYIRSGMMQKQCRSSVKTYLFVLFNDRLVYASKVVVTNKYKLHKEIEIDGVFRVVDVKDEEDGVKSGSAAGEDGSRSGGEERKDTLTPATTSSADTLNRLYKFKIYNSAKSFIVMTSDPAIKQQWLSDLRAVIAERKKTIPQLPTASSSFPASSIPTTHAPMFAGDHSSSTCQRCDKRFSLTVRKHHCRSCGKLCCAECLGARMKVRGEDAPVRVCWKCAGREEVRVKKEEEKKKADEKNKHDKEKEKEKEREAAKHELEKEKEQRVEQDILGILPV